MKIASILALLFLPMLALAQSTDDFMMASRTAAPDASTDYPLIRCAALQLSTMTFAGVEVMGEERYSESIEVQKEFGISAAIVRAKEKDLDPNSLIPLVINDIQVISDMYLDRYRTNTQTAGFPFANDQMWKDDQNYCAGLYERVIETAAGE